MAKKKEQIDKPIDKQIVKPIDKQIVKPIDKQIVPQIDEQIDKPIVEQMVKKEFVGRTGKIGKEQIEQALSTLQEYKRCKANLENRIRDNEQWYKLRHWEYIRGETEKSSNAPEPTSAWLFNSLLNKHADAMDNYPKPNILPRAMNDEEDAKTLSAIIPVILEQNEYEEIYSNKWWYKLKNGTSVEGIFWNSNKNNGLGDIDIRNIDILNLFWESGISNIQDSRNVFTVELVDNDLLEGKYPFLKGLVGGKSFNVTEYLYDDQVDTTNKSVVIDWYYKDVNSNGVQVLHYCKFCNGEVIYASENDEAYADRGYYDHGKYPFVFDTLFPTQSTPAGFGYIDIMKSPQLYIDKLNQSILENAVISSKKRYFARRNGSINIDEFLDFSNPIVNVEGGVGEDDIREITNAPLSESYINILQLKIEELKETSGNRDFSQGGTSAGVTAASAIAALQEAGSKLSRDMIKSSYRAFSSMNYIILELIRQFYDTPREFRITGEVGEQNFITFDNTGMLGEQQGESFGVDLGIRKPFYDIKISAEKSSPFSRASQNELAKELFNMGFFNPQISDQVQIAMDMMEFEGKPKVMQKIAENSQMYQQLQMMQQQMQQMAQIIDAQNPTNIGEGIAEENPSSQPAPKRPVNSIRDDNKKKKVKGENSIVEKSKERVRGLGDIK